MTEPVISENGTLARNEKQERAWMIGKRAIAVLCLAGIVSCALEGGGGSSSSSKPQSELERLESKVADDAITPIGWKDFSNVYSEAGKAEFDKASDLTRWAALAVADSDQCDAVETIRIGVFGSAGQRKIQWVANCGNDAEFQITQEQAEATRVKFDPAATAEEKEAVQRVAKVEPKLDRWKDFNEANTVSACDLTVQSAMLVPASFSTGWSRWEINKNDTTGVVIIERDYKSENAFSQKINGRYRCTVDTNKQSITGLAIREPDGWRKLR